jgi:hypothetical protein
MMQQIKKIQPDLFETPVVLVPQNLWEKFKFTGYGYFIETPKTMYPFAMYDLHNIDKMQTSDEEKKTNLYERYQRKIRTSKGFLFSP